MTAPCAWIYGIPVESFTDILTATKWNVAFLAIVSIWRVALIIRAIQVLTEEPLIKSICRILIPAAAIMTVASLTKGMELVGIMGGIRLSPDEKFLSSAINFTLTISFFTTVIALIIATILGLRTQSHTPQQLPWKSISPPIPTLISTSILLLIWLTSVIPYHKKSSNNQIVKSYIQNQQFEKAINYMSKHKRNDFLQTHHFPPGTGDSVNDIKIYYLPLLQNLKSKHPTWLKTQIIYSMKIQNFNGHDKLLNYELKTALTQPSDNFTPTPFSNQLWKEIKVIHDLKEATSAELKKLQEEKKKRQKDRERREQELLSTEQEL